MAYCLRRGDERHRSGRYRAVRQTGDLRALSPPQRYRSPEGQNVARPVTGDVLYMPLRLPTSKPPWHRNSAGLYGHHPQARHPRRDWCRRDTARSLMPRYPSVTSRSIRSLLISRPEHKPDRVSQIGISISPPSSMNLSMLGRERPFSTYSRPTSPEEYRDTPRDPARRARAWHESWTMETYRKWVPTFGAEGPRLLGRINFRRSMTSSLCSRSSAVWLRQLATIHAFCERSSLPCLFPVTDLPVVDELDFYSMYFSRAWPWRPTPSPNTSPTRVS